METPDTPANEFERLFALHRAHLLDTAPDRRFDDITDRAQRSFAVQTVLVSLVDENRQWFLSRQGLEATETERCISFCGHAILSDEMLLVPDTHRDPRFRDNPLVTGDPFIRFYAGQPVREPTGFRVGTLCLIDPKPRTLSSQEQELLASLAAEVESVIALRQQE
ncbi:GAF domain-containing protein [Congregibacter litoralis]|uniref:GAF domain protein n=1 Tax=Congregibacter litoralis KT71 TaxID=314285 RepID=A4ADK1_9GAMM|nr:GAF domain-containing protein [Congregibacter litoralis]EAQ95890.1 GAF domain protein [Congregibacter litoralis KT71]